MFIDAQTQLDSAHAYAATGLSTNAYDAGAAGVVGGIQNDVSIGQPLCVIVAVTVAAKVSGTTETYEFDIIQSATSNLAAPDILAQYAFTNALAGTLLKAGAILVLPIPPGSVTKEFLGTNFVGANTPTITITSWIAPMNMVQLQRFYGTKIVIL